MINLSETLLEDIRKNTENEKLIFKWRDTLVQLKVFNEELNEIKNKLNESQIEGRFNNLNNIEQRSLYLRFKLNII